MLIYLEKATSKSKKQNLVNLPSYIQIVNSLEKFVKSHDSFSK